MYTELQDGALMWKDNNEAAIFQTEDISGVRLQNLILNHNTVQKEFMQQLRFVRKQNPVKKTYKKKPCHHSSSDSLPQ